MKRYLKRNGFKREHNYDICARAPIYNKMLPWRYCNAIYISCVIMQHVDMRAHIFKAGAFENHPRAVSIQEGLFRKTVESLKIVGFL